MRFKNIRKSPMDQTKGPSSPAFYISQWPTRCLQGAHKTTRGLHPLHLRFWGSLLLKPRSYTYPSWLVLTDLSSINLSNPLFNASRSDAITTPYGKEFHRLITEMLGDQVHLKISILSPIVANISTTVGALGFAQQGLKAANHSEIWNTEANCLWKWNFYLVIVAKQHW